MLPITTYYTACALHFMTVMNDKEFYDASLESYADMASKSTTPQNKIKYIRASTITKLAYSFKNDRQKFKKDVLVKFLDNSGKLDLVAVLTPCLEWVNLHETLELNETSQSEGDYLKLAHTLKALQDVKNEVEMCRRK